MFTMLYGAEVTAQISQTDQNKSGLMEQETNMVLCFPLKEKFMSFVGLSNV